MRATESLAERLPETPAAAPTPAPEGRPRLSPHLRTLEAEAIFIMREVAAEFRNR